MSNRNASGLLPILIELGAVVLYFVLFAPLAIAFRLVAKDPLRLTPTDKTGSFWIDRPGHSYAPMTRQY